MHLLVGQPTRLRLARAKALRVMIEIRGQMLFQLRRILCHPDRDRQRVLLLGTQDMHGFAQAKVWLITYDERFLHCPVEPFLGVLAYFKQANCLATNLQAQSYRFWCIP